VPAPQLEHSVAPEAAYLALVQLEQAVAPVVPTAVPAAQGEQEAEEAAA